jgi:hypothetical protein
LPQIWTTKQGFRNTIFGVSSLVQAIVAKS